MNALPPPPRKTPMTPAQAERVLMLITEINQILHDRKPPLEIVKPESRTETNEEKPE